MAEKTIKTRIALRIDTFENWSKTEVEGKGANFVLNRGEIGLCEIPSNSPEATTAPTVLFKVGDGTSTFGELKWASALAADVYGWAKASDVILDGKKIKFVGSNKEIDLANFALIDDVNTLKSTLEAADTALGGRIDGVAERVTTSEGEISTLKNAVSALEDLVVGGEGEGINAIIGDVSDLKTRVGTAESKIETLESGLSTLSGTVESEIARVEGGVESSLSSLESGVKSYAEGLVSEADGRLADHISTYESAIGDLNSRCDSLGNAIADEESARTTAISGLEAEIERFEGVVGGEIDDLESTLKTYADGKASEVSGELANHISVYEAKVSEIENTCSGLSTDISNETVARTNAISGIEAEITRVDGLISTEVTDRTDAVSDLQTQINNINTNIASGLHFRGVVENKDAIETPVDGDICIVGNVEYIYSDGWKELGNAEAHATYEYVNTELAKKVDKGTYESKITELAGVDAAIRGEFAAADSALKSELEGKINGKVAQGDFDTLEGRVDGHDTAIAGKVAQGDFDAHINAYNTKVGALEAKDTEFAGKISAIETSLSTGDIHTEIDGVRTLAQKGVDDAAAVDGRVTTLSGTVDGISTKLGTVEATANAAAVKGDVEAAFASVNGTIETLATKETVNGIDGRLSTVEGKVSTVEGKVSTLEGKVSALEGTYSNDDIDGAISTAVATEKGRAESAEAALDGRIAVFENKFGGAEDILVFDCGSSTSAW